MNIDPMKKQCGTLNRTSLVINVNPNLSLVSPEKMKVCGVWTNWTQNNSQQILHISYMSCHFTHMAQQI